MTASIFAGHGGECPVARRPQPDTVPGAVRLVSSDGSYQAWPIVRLRPRTRRAWRSPPLEPDEGSRALGQSEQVGRWRGWKISLI
jgi:hypothetical protein